MSVHEPVDPFATQRERALSAVPSWPKSMRALAENKAWLKLSFGVRQIVVQHVAQTQIAELFDESGADPFAAASGKDRLRRQIVAQADAELIGALTDKQVKKLRSGLVESLGLAKGSLFKKDTGDSKDVLDGVSRIVSADIEARFPTR